MKMKIQYIKICGCSQFLEGKVEHSMFVLEKRTQNKRLLLSFKSNKFEKKSKINVRN